MDIKHLDWVDWIIGCMSYQRISMNVHLGEPAAGTFN